VAIPLVATEFRERLPALSPDGQWLAYSSDRTGRPEIYVRPFPDVESARIRISTEGGIAPVWANSGRELFYRDVNNALVSARIEQVPTFRVTGRETLFALPPDVYLNSEGHARFYDVAPDDGRFLMGRPIQRDDAPAVERIFLVNNFFEVVKQLVPN
jgi:serine/threonine-protein kinase